MKSKVKSGSVIIPRIKNWEDVNIMRETYKPKSHRPGSIGDTRGLCDTNINTLIVTPRTPPGETPSEILITKITKNIDEKISSDDLTKLIR